MTQDGGRGPGMEVLRERLNRLSQASLRINAGMDLNTVLQEARAEARALTEARYGMMTLSDGSGRAVDSRPCPVRTLDKSQGPC